MESSEFRHFDDEVQKENYSTMTLYLCCVFVSFVLKMKTGSGMCDSTMKCDVFLKGKKRFGAMTEAEKKERKVNIRIVHVKYYTLPLFILSQKKPATHGWSEALPPTDRTTDHCSLEFPKNVCKQFDMCIVSQQFRFQISAPVFPSFFVRVNIMMEILYSFSGLVKSLFFVAFDIFTIVVYRPTSID